MSGTDKSSSDLSDMSEVSIHSQESDKDNSNYSKIYNGFNNNNNTSNTYTSVYPSETTKLKPIGKFLPSIIFIRYIFFIKFQ